MKRSIKTMAIAAMAAAIGFTSCSKGNETQGIDNKEASSVALVLTEGETTKAVAAPATAAVVSFKSGYVLFTNSLGVIVKTTQIVPGNFPGSPSAAEQTAQDNGTMVWLEDMKAVNSGSEIKNVPASADKVYIVGNLPTGVTAPALSENISAVKDRVITFASQKNAAGDLSDVTLYGDGATILNSHPSLGAGVKYVKVDVNAIASRFEISKISYVSPTNFVTGFKIDGVFINYYYPQMSLAGKVSAALINNIGANNAAANAIYVGGSAQYSDASLYDYNAAGLGSSITPISYKADAGANVWAYNLIAPTSFAAPVTKIEAPHIIVRLSNITATTAGAYTTTQYLTVSKIKDKTTGTVIDKLEPGHIYFITDLQFDESKLDEVPEAETVEVYVEAKLMTWKRTEIEWGN